MPSYVPAMEQTVREEPDYDRRKLPIDGDVVRRRIFAFVSDAIFVGGAVLAVTSSLTRSRVLRITLTTVGTVLAGLPYHVVLEGTYGQTLGKRLFGIAVVREGGRPCTYTAATIRTFLRFVDGLPVAYLVGFASMALTQQHQRLGDLLAGTVVVRATRGREETRD